MNRSMINATNTMSQLQQQLDIIGHNMSNVNTTGYKKRDASFSEMLYQQIDNQSEEPQEVGRLTPLGIRQGIGAKLNQTKLILTKGTLQKTERLLDLALTNPNMFFQVQINDNGDQSIQYTKNGSFHVAPSANNTVQLVNGSGDSILDVNGNKIEFTANFRDIRVNQNGEMTIIPSDKGKGNQTFQLGITEIYKPQLLEAKGENLFAFPAEINEPNLFADVVGRNRDLAGIQQGALEQSNVDIRKEITDMTMTQRAYQFNAKSISIADQMMGLVNGIRT
ncbi:flagellar hook-basal body protein [Priestia megaterium]|nr:flagellar hook-basal body protein [Priestia megaterium]